MPGGDSKCVNWFPDRHHQRSVSLDEYDSRQTFGLFTASPANIQIDYKYIFVWIVYTFYIIQYAQLEANFLRWKCTINFPSKSSKRYVINLSIYCILVVVVVENRVILFLLSWFFVGVSIPIFYWYCVIFLLFSLLCLVSSISLEFR